MRFLGIRVTQMNWPTGVAIDPDRNELFIANDGGNSVLVFDANATGDAAPLRVIKGPRSLVSNPTGIYLDQQNHELWVTSFGNHTANVYSPDANGDAPPIRTIRSAAPNQPRLSTSLIVRTIIVPSQKKAMPTNSTVSREL